jgi:hypothetical protein
VAFYVQPVSGGELRLVLNAAHGGNGRGRSRWTRIAGQGGPAAAAADADGPVAAELTGTFGTNLNLRARWAHYEIDYPFGGGELPVERRLAPAELTVCHDVETDLVQLWSPRLGKAVLPVHGGMMSEALLPPLARLLVDGFGTTYLTHPTLSPLENVPGTGEPDGIVFRPRIEIGRVTLARARHSVPAAQVPARPPGEDDAGYLVRVTEWRLAHAIPRQCFVRRWDRRMRRDEIAFDTSHKPLYVDLANWPLVEVFEQWAAGATGDLEFTEALPSPEDAVAGARIAELIVELTATGS